MTMEAHIVSPGEIEAPLSEIRFLFLPTRDLFARRAERLRQLSPGHPLGDYLAFLALLADAQQATLDRFPAVPIPAAGEQALCRAYDMPLLAARSRRLDPAWREGLAMILRQMAEAALPTATRETVTRLASLGESELEGLADRVLGGDVVTVPPQELPFIAAALQVYWVRMASLLGEQAFGPREETETCPVCGSHPVAGVVHTGGAEQGLRYLCCSLCATQWHYVRIKCSTCASTEKIDFFTLEGSNGTVKAESCNACGTYLKLLYLEKESRMEAQADDLATLALDMLMEKEGKVRGGPNLFFHPGAA